MVFGKLGELGDILKIAKLLQDQVKQAKEELEKARFENEQDGVKCVVSGDMELKEFTINPDLLKKSPEEIERKISRVVDQTYQEAKNEVFSKFKKMAGKLPIPGIF